MDRRIRHLTGHVVVGVGTSHESVAAVAEAARTAQRRGAVLQILHAVDPGDDAYTSGPHAYADAHGRVGRAARQALAAAPGLDVEPTVVRASPVGALLDVAEDAALVVLGSRGLGPVTGVLLGSVGLSLVARAPCPVLVVRDDDPAPAERSATPPRPGSAAEAAGQPSRRGTVVVGIAGRECRPAVAAALDEAMLRDARLMPLHAWSMPLFPSPGTRLSGGRSSVAAVRADARRHFDEVLGGLRDNDRHVRVTDRLVRDSAGHALVSASQHAELVVVAARKKPPGLGPHIGPVTRLVLHHAACPVLVVPADTTVGARARGLFSHHART